MCEIVKSQSCNLCRQIVEIQYADVIDSAKTNYWKKVNKLVTNFKIK